MPTQAVASSDLLSRLLNGQLPSALIWRRLLVVLLVFTTAFPYTQPFSLASYTQPHALFVGFAIVVLSGAIGLRRMGWVDALNLLSLAAIGLLIFALTCYPYRDVQEYKHLLIYLTPLVMTTAFVTAARWDAELLSASLAGSIVVWFWIALAQTLLNVTFLTALLGPWAGSVSDIAASGRGVLGLAPEPTHHAFHVIVLCAGLSLLGRHRWVLLLGLAEAVLLARSASGLMLIAIAIVAVLIVVRPRAVVLLILAVAGTMLLPVGEYLASIGGGSRMVRLVASALEDPVGIIGNEYSINMRIGGLLASMGDIITSLFYPRGISVEAWAEGREQILATYRFLIDLSSVGVPSGFGVLLYQAGILVVPFIWIVGSRVLGGDQPPAIKVFIAAGLLAFAFQYYISAPQFGLLYACAIYAAARRTQRPLEA